MNERSRRVPSARLARLAAFGQIAGGIATGVLGEGARRLTRGERPQLPDLLLTPRNAQKMATHLSRLRGAAMKLGQMLSMDAGDVLPAELTVILAQLRDQAHVMPPRQLEQVLTDAWGQDWRRRFAHFDDRPLAAASIGQVHRAVLPSGEELAIKVQYPGVAASIDADIDNMATLLRLSGLLPAGLDVAPLLIEAKRQLREEADYLREAGQMRRYGALLADDTRFIVPRPIEALLRPTVLPMTFQAGAPIETLASASEAQRDAALGALVDLVLRELFDFGLMQTDPNFANYRWQADTGRIVLLDFGAARPVTDGTAARYRSILRAGLSGDAGQLREALAAADFVSPAQDLHHRSAIETMIGLLLARLATEDGGLVDFADRCLVAELRRLAAPLLADRGSWHVPPAETLFVQRKIGGTAQLCARLEARLPLLDLLSRYA